MKKIIPLLLLGAATLTCQAQEEEENYVASDLLASLEPGDKAAVLMVHFGTTYDDTRSRTIDAINAKVQAAYPDLKLEEAYTSRIIIGRLKKRGIEKRTPLEALFKLRAEGYTHVVVQSTNIIDGVEIESLRADVASVAPFFKEIRIGTPLLYSVKDSQKVVEIIAGRHPADAKKKQHVTLVGHGTSTPGTAIYSQIDYMFKASGRSNYHVGTIEGYPTFETMLTQLKADKAKSVTLVPFMFVAGDHANNDIAVEWKEELENEGLTVEVSMKGLGEIPEIQDIFIDHLRFQLTHRTIGIMEKKADFAKHGKQP